MRISIIGPATQIPPIGWGAVESLIWDYKLSLEELDHEVPPVIQGGLGRHQPRPRSVG